MDLRSVWQYRELLYFLVWRDVKIRYKQTAIGAAWAIAQPLMTMIVFTFVFGTIAKVSSDGLPYPLFSYSALVPWTYFAQAISRSGISVVQSANLVGKVYFPRLIIPIAGAVGPLVDLAIALSVLFGLMLWFEVIPTWRVVLLPLFVAIALITALAAGLWLSALNVKYRDVGHAIPFLVQVMMYLSPVAYSINSVPAGWRWLYRANPMVGVIEGFRWALLGQPAPDASLIAISMAAIVISLLGGLVYFKRTERTFADVI